MFTEFASDAAVAAMIIIYTMKVILTGNFS